MNSGKSQKLIVLGLCLMALRAVVQMLVDRSGHTNDLTDFGFGLLMGIGIGITLFGMWQHRRSGGSCTPAC